jgi:predicted RNase H-like HicB family nuclease
MHASTNKKMTFLYTIIYDEEYRGYVVDVPQLPGCMSQGKSIERALENTRKAIRLYLKETGRQSVFSIKNVMTGQLEVSV